MGGTEPFGGGSKGVVSVAGEEAKRETSERTLLVARRMRSAELWLTVEMACSGSVNELRYCGLSAFCASVGLGEPEAPSACLESKTESAEGATVGKDVSLPRGVAMPDDRWWAVLEGSRVEAEAERSELCAEKCELPFVHCEEGAKDADIGIFGSDPGPTCVTRL